MTMPSLPAAALRQAGAARAIIIPRAGRGSTIRRHFHPSPPRPRPAADAEPGKNNHKQKPSAAAAADGSRTGNGSPKPKISNLSMPGGDRPKDLTEEQKNEVDQHNKEFAEKFDHGQTAADDKVDKRFWKGSEGGRE